MDGITAGAGGISGSMSPPSSMSGEMSIPTYIDPGLRPATRATLGGIIVGEDLEITQTGVLSVTKATAVEQDNTHPITAAAVYTEVGNISALLQTI